ncbi:MAG: hypothetical protein JXA94_01235 [Parachlamydiales bacterium]|nr:hypothetical protein [Parachlamydiales bacterium]
MKYFKFFIFLLIFSSISLFSNENPIAIKSTVRIKNTYALILEDDSIWVLFNFCYRAQTWSEWWHSIDVIKDEKYSWRKDQWYVNDLVTIENKNNYPFCLDSLSENSKIAFDHYQFHINNLNSQKCAFARPISLENLLKELHNYAIEQYNLGYSNGHYDGHSRGYSKGHSDGYNKGSSNY